MKTESTIDFLTFKMCIVNQYVNTPLLDKIKHFSELPEDINDWVDFDMKLNLDYSNNIKEIKSKNILGYAKFIKNAKGNSRMKNLTIGKNYTIIERLSREEVRMRNPNFCDGFVIIKDDGKRAGYFNENFFEVNWNN